MNREQQLARILEGWLDGGLGESEQAALLGALDSDPELRRAVAEQLATLGAVRAAEDPHPRWLALFDLLEQDEPAACKVVDFERSTMTKIESIRARPWHARAEVLAAAAALILLVAVGVLLQQRNHPDPASVIPPPAGVRADPVAIVLSCRGDSSLEAGGYIYPGRLAQSDGWTSLQTLHGVTITLGAPFDATLVAHDEVLIRHGRARVHVPSGAEGFRLHSPGFKITDLGTEFAVEVGEDGSGRCRVFEGRANVSLVDSLGLPTATRRLQHADSVRIEPSQQVIQAIDERDADYPELKRPDRAPLRLATGYPAAVMRLRPTCYWRFESLDGDNTVRNEVAGGPGMHPRGSATISGEAGGNHAGSLANFAYPGFFEAGKGMGTRLQGDFGIGFFAQFEWLQNYAMVSTLKYSPGSEGHPFVLQAYASLGQSGLNGTGVRAVVRDPPAWNGGTELFGNTLLRPRFWHHIAATRKGGILTLFLDGKVVAREQIDDARLDFDYFYVGRLNANLDQSRAQARRLVGHIDELAIFRRALAAGEVRQLAAGKVEPR